jgi:hypothetical protein
MDREEARLEEEVRRRREELVTKGESLRRSVVDKFDPREIVKRNPVGGLLASVGVGIFVGKMLTGRGSRGKNGEAESKPSADPSLASLAMGLLPGLLSRVAPMFVAPLLSFFQRERSPDEANGGQASAASTSEKK